jgi:hypothetical protein
VSVAPILKIVGDLLIAERQPFERLDHVGYSRKPRESARLIGFVSIVLGAVHEHGPPPPILGRFRFPTEPELVQRVATKPLHQNHWNGGHVARPMPAL